MENLIGKKVKINIKDPTGYTSDLYKSIQGEIGEIIEKQREGSSSYKDAYIVRLGKTALAKYKKTHSGKWSHAHNMERWTESKDFEIVA